MFSPYILFVIEVDRFFGNSNNGLKEKRQDGRLNTRQDYIDHIEEKYTDFNANAGYEKYKYFELEIAPQGEMVEIFDFNGITTTLWIRALYCLEEQRLKSITNLISPWETAQVKDIHTKGRLRAMKIEKKRSTKTYIKSTDPEPESKSKFMKCVYQNQKRNAWLASMSNLH